MPWTSADAPKKIKNKKDREKWASIANAIYKECMKDGDDKTCAPKAIRIANSKFMEEGEMKGQKVPYGALRLVDSGCHAMAVQDEGSQGKKLNMTVYSGGVIKNHWWWGNLAIDISGVQFDRNKYPVLENHDTGKKLAFSKRPVTKNNKIEIDPETTVFVDTEESREFQKLSSGGFPFQASMYAIPTVLERVTDGETVDVNGFKFKGPGSVWRRCLYQEASACVFGWDKDTQAKAFSKDEFMELEIEEVMLNNDGDQQLTEEEGKEVSEMPLTLEQIQKDSPDLLKQIQVAAVAEAETKFQKERDAWKVEKDRFTADIVKLTAEKEALDTRVSKLEKADAQRQENDKKLAADAIWDAQLAASDLSPKQHAKIKLHVRTKDHLGVDGNLDVVKFTTAVQAEIKEWEADGEQTVLGGAGGGGFRETDAEAKKTEKLAKENKELADNLLRRAGQEVKT